MRISDWSSDVCSSDLGNGQDLSGGGAGGEPACRRIGRPADPVAPGGGGRRTAGLPARRHEGKGRSLSAAALRRALRHVADRAGRTRSEEHTSELQSLMRISYAVLCLKKKTKTTTN